MVLNGANGFANNVGWVGGWISGTGNPDATNTTKLTGTSAWPYQYNSSIGIYKCPADQSTVTIGGTTYPRERSVSLNGFLNGDGSQLLNWGKTYFIYRKTTQRAFAE